VKQSGLSNFEKGQIVGVRLVGTFVTKTATLLGVLRVTVSKVMLAYMNHRKTTSAKRNSGQESTLTERGYLTLRRIVLKNHRTNAAQVTAEHNIRLEDPVSTKTVRHDLHKSSIHGRAAIGEPPITESSAQIHTRWYHNHKKWTPDNLKCTCDMVR
jgi:hypothetical protein